MRSINYLGRAAVDLSKVKIRCTPSAVRRKAYRSRTTGTGVDKLDKIDMQENKVLGLSLGRYRNKSDKHNAVQDRTRRKSELAIAIVRAKNRRQRKFARLLMEWAERDVPNVVMGEIDVAMGREG